MQGLRHELEDVTMGLEKVPYRKRVLGKERQLLTEEGLTPKEIKARVDSLRFGVDLHPENPEQDKLARKILSEARGVEGLRKDYIKALKADPDTRGRGLALEEEQAKRELDLRRRQDELRKRLMSEGPGRLKVIDVELKQIDGEVSGFEERQRRLKIELRRYSR